MAPTQAPCRLIEEQRHVREEVAAGELEFDDGAVALAARVSTGADRAQVVPVSHLDKAEAIEQLADERDPGHTGHVVLARLHSDRGNPAQRPGDDKVLDLEQRRGSLHRTGAPFLAVMRASNTRILPG